MRELDTFQRGMVGGEEHLWFLERLDRVNQAIQGSDDIEQLMWGVLDVVLEIYDADRCWLMYPCDPDSPVWRVPMERTHPDFPGALQLNRDLPTLPEHARVMRITRESSGPVEFGPDGGYPIPASLTAAYQVESMLCESVNPKNSRPWMFGIHQCRYPRSWTVLEKRLFQETARRLGDALTTFLAIRDLRENEQRLVQAAHIAHVGYWERDFENARVTLSRETLAIFGLPPDKTQWDLPGWQEQWSALIHPEDRSMADRAASVALDEGGARYELEYRVIRPTGEIRTVRSIADLSRNEVGQPLRMFGTMQDISEQRRMEETLRASERRFRTFVDHATDAFFLHDSAGVVLDVNQEACDSLGYTREELIGMSPMALDSDLDQPYLDQLIARLEAGELVAIETHHRRKDGTEFPAEVRLRPFWEGDRRFTVCMVHDITERKWSQEALTLFRSLIDHANEAIIVVERGSRRILDANETTWRMLGYTREEFLSLRLNDLAPPGMGALRRRVQRDLRDAGSSVFETACRRKDGSFIPVEANVAVVHLDRTYLIGIVRDIAERKRADEALRASQERMRLAVQATNVGTWDWDLGTGKVVYSREWKRQIGYSEEEISEDFAEWESRLHPEDRDRIREAVDGYLNGRSGEYAVEFRFRHKDGTYRWIYTRGAALRNGQGEMIRMLGCHLDITERKMAEEELAYSLTLLNAVVEGTSDAVFVKDLEGRYLMSNSAGARFLGRTVEEVIGRQDDELLTANTARNVQESDRQVLSAEKTQVFEETATAAGITRTYLATKGVYRDEHGNALGTIGISRDVTELKRLEEQFNQAQKMEAVGRLAGGIAHDFNNLLTVIGGNSELAFNQLRPEDPVRDLIAQVQRTSERAATLTRQLLAFSRKQVLEPQRVSVNSVLEDLIGLLQRLIGENVQVTLSTCDDLGVAKVDHGQLEQAIINLSVNARDAMPRGGRLTIETRNAELDETSAPDAAPGPYVLVSVSDSGQGMDEATRERIFEPFFTTKASGKGTGLGLAMVYGFVKQSGGHIEVSSREGEGTTFQIYLPRAPSGTRPAKNVQENLRAPTGSETILLVEDEDAVRVLATRVLQSNGYTVLEACDGVEALRVARRCTGVIHLLLTDMVMPRMSGIQLATELTETRRTDRVLFISGYTEVAVDAETLGRSKVAFLQKPFTTVALAQKVREILDAALETM